MISLSLMFIIIYVITVVVFLVMPKKALLKMVRRDLGKNFNPNNLKSVNTYALGYYKLIILGGAVVATIITLILKLLFY